jgi:hypothetical protein
MTDEAKALIDGFLFREGFEMTQSAPVRHA